MNEVKKLGKKIMAGIMAGVGMAAFASMTAEAGSIPRNMCLLYTYAVRHVDCYLSAGGQKKGYIDAGDYVIVTSVRSDGWAYGSYPAGRSRVSRWFRLDDLVQNMNFANQNRYSPKINTAVYTTASLKATIGTFNGNEPITVVSDNGNNRQVIYKLSNGSGYKMGWVPEWDCWTAERAGKRPVPAPQPSGNPIVKPVSRPNANATTTSTPQPKTAWINTQSQNLNMRAGTGTNYRIVGKLAKGTQVTVLETLSNGWSKISSSAGTGYVSSQYIAYDKPIPNNNASVRDRLMVTVFNQSGAYISCDWDGYKKIKGRHAGIDMVLYHRAPVYAAISGTVIRTGISNYNTFAIYDQANDKTVVYLHFDSFAPGIKEGDYVTKGTHIGYQGKKSPTPVGSHVHIEVRDGRQKSAAKSISATQIQTSNPYPYWEKVL